VQINESFINKYPQQNGVYILSEVKNEFESTYLEVRKKEHRVYTDEELKNLPFATENSPHLHEWKVRGKSFLRFKNYISSKTDGLDILDLGCGNGWFSGQLSKSFKNHYYCMDVNLPELKQGRKVFNSDNIAFIYADIFTTEFPTSYFDFIIVNAAVQYFKDLGKLINNLSSLLADNGEIHIIDSPFYSEHEVDDAKKRTANYYSSIGYPEMAENYFHHSWNELSNIDFTILYDPKSKMRKFKKLLFINDSPFPWIKINR